MGSGQGNSSKDGRLNIILIIFKNQAPIKK